MPRRVFKLFKNEKEEKERLRQQKAEFERVKQPIDALKTTKLGGFG